MHPTPTKRPAERQESGDGLIVPTQRTPRFPTDQAVSFIFTLHEAWLSIACRIMDTHADS